MGISQSRMIRMLKTMKTYGVKGKSLLMLGKQSIKFNTNFINLLYRCDFVSKETRFSYDEMNDSELFFKRVGFEEVHSMDYSNYEGADIIFNLNDDLPDELIERFDYVIDGGTLEHCFNVAKVIENIARLVKKGGCIFHGNPAANWVNHGFYTLSPTFYTDFYESNGFEIDEYVFEFTDRKSKIVWYSPDVRMILESVNDYVSKSLHQNIPPALPVLVLNYVVARKTTGEINCLDPVQERYRIVYDKTEQINGILDVIRNSGSIYLYGAGSVFRKIMPEIKKSGLENKIAGVFDKDINKVHAENIMGKEILLPTPENISRAEAILICSTAYGDEIYNELKNMGVNCEKVFKITDYLK